MSDFESGAFNRALPTLRFVINDLPEALNPVSVLVPVSMESRNQPAHNKPVMRWCKVRIPLGYGQRLVPVQLSNSSKIRTGDYQSTGEGVPIAMPCVFILLAAPFTLLQVIASVSRALDPSGP